MNLEYLFRVNKPIIGMIHLKGENARDRLERAKKEIDIYIQNEVNAVLIENYFGNADDVERVLNYLSFEYSDLIYGVNILGDYATAFYLADEYDLSFIQIDSVAGHLNQDDDKVFEEDLTENAVYSRYTPILGGVRFKYQPVLSGNTLEQDLKLGMNRCEIIVVTGDGTGKMTPVEKIKEFRSIVKDFPIIVGAGLTLENCEECLQYADGGIVGSYFKHNYKDNGEVSPEHVKEFMDKVKTLRK